MHRNMTIKLYAKDSKRFTTKPLKPIPNEGIDMVLRIAIFVPFLYPFHIDMLNVMNSKVKAKVFTCGIYGNHPFEHLMTHAEVLRCVHIMNEKVIDIRDIIKFMNYRPYGVIIFGIEGLAGLLIYFISKIMKVKTLVIVEENYITQLNNVFLKLLQKIKRSIIRLVYEDSPILVAESYASKQYVLEVLRCRRDKPLIVRPHGVNTERFKASLLIPKKQAKQQLIKILGLQDDLAEKMWCTFIGELSYSKGADVLIDAIEILWEKLKIRGNVIFLLPKTRFLHDKREIRDQYMRKIAKLLSYGIIRFYNPLKPEDMPLLYRASEIVVLPSRLLSYASSDRSPNVALEALATGSLLVASYAGGIPSIVGDAAILVRPNDPVSLASKLLDVINNYEKYEYIKKKALERAAKELDIKLYSLTLLMLLTKYK
ncbi:MAG: glycosyltransferase family 4 protein [Thermoprotei archaeon]